MKHSIPELVNLAYTLFPRGMQGDEPDYEQTPEVLRQAAAHAGASRQYATWRGLLRKLEGRFPEDRFPGVAVHDQSLYLQDPGGTVWARCFTGELWLPARSPGAKNRTLRFLVSFVVPCYVVFRWCNELRERAAGTLDPQSATSFELSPDESAFAKVIIEEIELAYPGYAPIPPEVGRTVIPDIVTERKRFGEAEIFGCFFSDDW